MDIEIGEVVLEVARDTLTKSPRGIPQCRYNKSTYILNIMLVKATEPIKKTVLFLTDSMSVQV